MNLKFTLLTAFCFVTFLLSSQPAIDWEKSIGGSGTDIVYDIIQSNNAFYISGFTNSQDGDFIDNPFIGTRFLLKTDLQGEIQWVRYLGNPIFDIQKSRDNKILLIQWKSTGTFELSKWDEAGNKLWVESMSNAQYSLNPVSVGEYEDNKYLIVGSISSPSESVFQLTFDQTTGAKTFSVNLKEFTGPINFYFYEYYDVVNFQDTILAFGYKAFFANGIPEYEVWPPVLDNFCDAAAGSPVECSDASILFQCGSSDYIRTGGNSTYIFTVEGLFTPLAGNPNTNWLSESDSNFNVHAYDDFGQFKYNGIYGGSGEDELIKASLSCADLYLIGNTDSNDGDISMNHGETDIWFVKLASQSGPIIPIVSIQDTTFLCPEDSLYLLPEINCCIDCNFMWNNGMNTAGIFIRPDASQYFDLVITNPEGFQDTLTTFVEVQVMDVSYSITNNSDCPGSEYLINFDLSNCQDCNVYFQNSILIGDEISLYPTKDQTFTFKIKQRDCTELMEVPLDVYDLEANVEISSCEDEYTVTVSPIGGQGDITILWEDGNTEFIRTDLNSGNFSFSLKDDFCSTQDTITILDFNDYTRLSSTSISHSTEYSPILIDQDGNYYFTIQRLELAPQNPTLRALEVDLIKVNSSTNDFKRFENIIRYAEIDRHVMINLFLENNIICVKTDYTKVFVDSELNLIPNPSSIYFSDRELFKISGTDTMMIASLDFEIEGVEQFPDQDKIFVHGTQEVAVLDQNGGVISNRILEYGSVKQTNISDSQIYLTAVDFNSIRLITLNYSLEEISQYFLPDLTEDFFYTANDFGISISAFKKGIILSFLDRIYRFSPSLDLIWEETGFIFNQVINDSIYIHNRSGTIYSITDGFDFIGIVPDTVQIENQVEVCVPPGSQVLWSTGDTTTTVTITDPGIYIIEITTPEGCTLMDTIYTAGFINSIDESTKEINNIRIQPNPNQGHFLVKSELPIDAIFMYNQTGQLIYSEKQKRNSYPLSFDNLPPGLYFIQCWIEGKAISKKLIIQDSY